MNEQLVKALEAITPFDTPDTAVLCATARGLMYGYDARWTGSAFRVASVENEFHLPIVNPDTGRSSRTYTHAGKSDGIVEFEGKFYLCEHKTCSEDIADPNSPYWQRLDIDAQVSGYVLANWQSGLKLDGTLYDVIRKPGIRPKAITKGDAQEIFYKRTYCGFPVPPDFKVEVTQAGLKEEPCLFELRVARECLDTPNYYFARKTISRLDSQILDYARELWAAADEIRLANIENRHYRNTGSCMAWNRPCTFLGICSGRDEPTSDKWRKRLRIHPELPKLESDGRTVLSHSRMACFKQCRRKHFYQYEMGIERADKEEEESLYFGSLMHAALAEWWRALTPYEEKPCQQVS